MNIDRSFWKSLTSKQFIRNQNVAMLFGQALVNTFPKSIYLNNG